MTTDSASPADRAAEIREDFARTADPVRAAFSHWDRDDIAALLDRIGELEGQLDEQRWYGEQLQTALDSCSGNHMEIQEYPGGVSDVR